MTSMAPITWADAVTGKAAPQPPATPRADEPQPGPPQDSVSVSVTSPNGTVLPPERLLDLAGTLGKDLKDGDKITVTAEGEPVLEIRKDAVTGLEHFKNFATDAIRLTTAQVSNVVAQDPSFAFKQAALIVKPFVYGGIPYEYTSMADQAFLPMIRVVSIALTAKQAMDTWKSERASRTDKTVDTVHVGTDILGLGGAIARVIPGLPGVIGTTLTVVGVVGDVAAYGYHMVKFFRERGFENIGTQQQPQQPQKP
ncbi:MAG: hypothetical protein FJX76_14750 [Armatimonadetes bacterium]|nr:hypothetical protein [Armatimonadota bacterium]